MTEEEKEAILHFKKYENKLVYEINEKDKRYAKTILNYIDKLEKENKELKEDNSHQWEERCRLTFKLDKLQKEVEEEKEKHKATIYNFELVVDKLENSISKDKIRNKIKELEDFIEKEEKETMGRCITIGETQAIFVLKELLGE